ncbi:MAG: hypothetical protein AAGF11_12960 [Myxococcota bacterium]
MTHDAAVDFIVTILPTIIVDTRDSFIHSLNESMITVFDIRPSTSEHIAPVVVLGVVVLLVDVLLLIGVSTGS